MANHLFRARVAARGTSPRGPVAALVASALLAGACGTSDASAPAVPDARELVSDLGAEMAGLDDEELAEELSGAQPSAAVGSWSGLDPLPVAEPEAWRTSGAVWTGEHVLVLGGDPSPGAGGRTELFRLDPTVGRWEARTTLVRTPQPWTRLAWAGGHLVVVGGDGTGAALRVDAWDAATDTWERGPDVPLEPRGGFSLTSVGDEVVLFGGLVEAGAAGAQRRTFGDGAAWVPGQASWRILPEAPVPSRTGHAAVWTGDALVVLGGLHAPDDPDGAPDEPADGIASWDPATNAWTVLPSSEPIGAAIVGAAWIDAGGGSPASSAGGRIVWWDGTLGSSGASAGDGTPAGGLFDPATGEVDPIADPPFTMRRDEAPLLWAPELGAAVTWGGACGEGCNQNADDGALYDVEADRWIPLPPVDLGRRHAAVVWTGRELVVVGGSVADQASQAFGNVVDGAMWRP